MTLKGLNFISSKLEEIGVPYCFEEWTKEITYPYFVGEYTESEPLYEDGESESTFILTGTTKGSWLELEQFKDKVLQLFPHTGLTPESLENMVFGAGVLYKNFTYGDHYKRTFDKVPQKDKKYYYITGGSSGGIGYTESKDDATESL